MVASGLSRSQVTVQVEERVQVGVGVQLGVVRVVIFAQGPEHELVALPEVRADDGDRRVVIEPPGLVGGWRLAGVVVAEPEEFSLELAARRVLLRAQVRQRHQVGFRPPGNAPWQRTARRR